MLDYELKLIDIKTAFLNGPLDEELYLRRPEILGSGYWRVFKLKGPYSLKQAGRQCYVDLNQKLEVLNFRRAKSEWSVHERGTESARSISATSADDMLVASSSRAKYTCQVCCNSDIEAADGCCP